MKGRALILIFLILILLTTAHAETVEDSFNHVGSASEDYVTGYHSGGSLSFYITGVKVNDMETLADMKFLQLEVPGAALSQTADSKYQGVGLSIGGDPVGTGIYGYNYNPDRSVARIQMWVTSLDTTGYSGSQILTFTSTEFNIQTISGGQLGRCTSPSSDSKYAYFHYIGDDVASANPSADYDVQSSYVKTFDFNYSNDYGVNRFFMERDTNLQSKFNITIDDYLVKGESVTQTYDVDYVNSSFNTWTVRNEDVYGDVITKTLMFGGSIGTIDFNQTSYVDPENIEVEWNIEGFDNNSFNYEIQIVTSISGDPSQDSWAADGNWNTSPFISSASGAAVFDFYSDGYDLPIWIQAELWAQDKNTGVWTRLDNSLVEIYHEAVAEAGMVWTNKESYNVTEIVTIYTDTVDGGYLMVDKRNDPLYDSYIIFSGLSNVKFALQTSHVGTWDVYLYENNIITNSTVFTVLADNDTAYFSWWGDVQKGEAAYYDYVATSSNSVISVYDHLGTKQYSFNATPGYNEGQISTMPGVAGNWTGSLYDNGVYYNSSLEVYASESWIRFVDDAYYLGDTIEIEYFIVDPEYNIRLRDGLCQHGGRSTILTWMPGSFHTGQRGILEFTLSNDNEFGLQVETNFESGYYLPGEWEVEASGMTQRGYGSTDDTTHVYASGKTDPGDTSNEMISIFFSPEGVFMLYTVALTMMGLVLAKHPAGGGAGATVGVGFGVYFNVLPPWMLMLVVILLVVLGGVSVAAYYRGK